MILYKHGLNLTIADITARMLYRRRPTSVQESVHLAVRHDTKEIQMRAWSELRERIEELRLTPVQREIARYLIEGAHTRNISATMGIPEIQVKLYAVYLLHALRKQPPGAPLAINPSPPLPRKPGGTGVALRLPQ